jgi:hypothetical protein
MEAKAAVAVALVAVIAVGGLNLYTYYLLNSQISSGAAEVSSLRDNNSQIQSQISQLKAQLSKNASELSVLQNDDSELQSQLSHVNVEIGNLSVELNLTQGNITSLTKTLSAFHAVKVFQANYVGNGESGHNISIPFSPVLIFIVDDTAGMAATIYFGVNDTAAYYFTGLQLSEVDYSYGAGVGEFYHDGMFNISWVGSAPVGTMNMNGDKYQAFFYW